MRTFVVANDSYMGQERADVEMIKARDFRDLIEDHMGFEIEENTCGHCGEAATIEDVVEQWNEANGNAGPNYVIKEVITELDGIKLVDVPELSLKKEISLLKAAGIVLTESLRFDWEEGSAFGDAHERLSRIVERELKKCDSR